MACFCTKKVFWAGIGIAAVIVVTFFIAKHINKNDPNDGIDKEINVARIELLAENIDKETLAFDLKHYAFDKAEPKIVSGSWQGLILEFYRIDTINPWNKTILQIQLPASEKFNLKRKEDSVWFENCTFPLKLQENYADSVFSLYDSTKVYPYVQLRRMTRNEDNTFEEDVLYFDTFTIKMEVLEISKLLITTKVTFTAAISKKYQHVYGGDYRLEGTLNLEEYNLIKLQIR